MANETVIQPVPGEDSVNTGRRRFLTATPAVVGAVGAGFAAVPFIKSWSPSARARFAGAPVSQDIGALVEGLDFDSLLKALAARRGYEPAFRDPPGRRDWSDFAPSAFGFAELDGRVDRLANLLLLAKPQPGACVAILAPLAAKAVQMAERLELTPLLARHPYDLSGGQQQLLALAKLMLTRPRLLLLDEPTKGLDLEMRREVARMVGECRDEGVTVVIASHDVAFLAEVADRTSLLFDGAVTLTGETDEFLRESWVWGR